MDAWKDVQEAILAIVNHADPTARADTIVEIDRRFSTAATCRLVGSFHVDARSVGSISGIPRYGLKLARKGERLLVSSERVVPKRNANFRDEFDAVCRYRSWTWNAGLSVAQRVVDIDQLGEVILSHAVLDGEIAAVAERFRLRRRSERLVAEHGDDPVLFVLANGGTVRMLSMSSHASTLDGIEWTAQNFAIRSLWNSGLIMQEDASVHLTSAGAACARKDVDGLFRALCDRNG